MCERLDRVVVKVEWCLRFQEALVTRVLKLKSDHCAILAYATRERKVMKDGRKFWFLAPWLTHKGFK